MHKAYVTKFFSRNERGVKYALYNDDTALEAHRFVLASAKNNDPIYVGVVNILNAAIKAGAEEVVVYIANPQVLTSIEKPHTVTSSQTLTYLHTINALRQQVRAVFCELPFADLNNQYWNAHYALNSANVEQK